MDAVTLAMIKGLGGSGSSLPSVSASDNGKVLTVENGAWAAQANDIVLNATFSLDDTNQNFVISIESELPTPSDLEAWFDSNRSITLIMGGTGWVARLQPGLRETDSGDIYYTFEGRGLSFDYDKLKFVLRFRVESLVVSCYGRVYVNEKFIVTLTPTALDYSGTMDKTVAEINAAYEAGQEIVFHVYTTASTYYEIGCTDVYFDQAFEYPRFCAVFVYDNANVIVKVSTPLGDDGTAQAYGTTIYSLTPAS